MQAADDWTTIAQTFWPWIQAADTWLSIAGFFITVWALREIRTLKKQFEGRAIMPTKLAALEKAASELSIANNCSPFEQASAAHHITLANHALKASINYCIGPTKRSLKEQSKVLVRKHKEVANNNSLTASNEAYTAIAVAMATLSDEIVALQSGVR